MYYIDKTYSKRTYELIFGSVLMLFAFVPVSHYPFALSTVDFC